MKKSEILQEAVANYLCKRGERTGLKVEYLCLAVEEVGGYTKCRKQKEIIRKDILEFLEGTQTVEGYMLTRAGYPTPEQAYDFRINLANQLIAKYKEQEKCNHPFTKLSNLFSKLKVALKNKLF